MHFIFISTRKCFVNTTESYVTKKECNEKKERKKISKEE